MSHSRTDYTTNSHNTYYSNNTHSFNNDIVLNVSTNVTDERSEILAWLSPLEPRIRHQDIRTRRADNVGEWLLQTDEFQRWFNSAQQEGFEHPVLFCCGDPAVGKTYFSSLVVDWLCDKAEEQNIGVACFYIDFATREEQSPTNMLGSLLKQIVGGLGRIPDEISRAFQGYKKVIGGRGLRVAEIVKLLQTVTSLRPTFICVDALDECVEQHRPEILDSFGQILEKSPTTRIFITGRQHIRGEIGKHLGGKAGTLSIAPNSDDIMGYVRMRLSKDTSLDAMDSGLEEEIINAISENIPETFLLISLTMDSILGEMTTYGRREKLKAMTQGLDLKGVYGATIERIKEQGGEKTRLGMASLMWVSHSARLLQLDELPHALAIQMGATDPNAERIPSVGTLLGCCLGLVVVDREASALRLIHFTLQEYLYTCPELFGAAHSIMAETCLTYLSSQTINEMPLTLLVLPQSTPFLKYSSLYWGTHARKEPSKDVISLALKLFSRLESHISTKLLLVDLISRTGPYSRGIPINGPLIGFTGLHCVSVFGIVEIAAALMDRPNSDLNARDFLGITPLIWAAICGQEGVATLLLERRNVNPDKPDGYFHRAALAWAAGKGHEGIVKILLGRASAKPDGTDGWWGKTSRVVNKVRGKRFVNPNSPDKYGQTPILLAAEEGHEGVVQLLLARKDVNPHTADRDGRTPLFCASSVGCEGVVKLLVERGGVSIDRSDKNGQTLLLWAAECGYKGVVGLLLERKDINPNMRDAVGRTPLSLASEKGHDEVVKLLLRREDVDPNMADYGRQTPLSCAVLYGRDGIVKLLLEREDVNPDMPDNDGRTSLSCAAARGYDGIMRLLLGRWGVNPDMPDNDGRTPLSWAAGNGYEGVVKVLLEREDVNPDMPDHDGRTPLWQAADNGHEGVVELLLGRKDVNPNTADDDGRTPLSWAAGNGYEGVAKLLLRREGVSPDMADNGNRTPLSWAAMGGHSRVMELLLEQEDVNPDLPDNAGQTPLSRAAMDGYVGIVKLLLGRKDVNPDMPDHDGRTPLWQAADNGHEGVVELLLEREDVNSNMPDQAGLTPLSIASKKRHQGVAKLLQARATKHPNMA